MCIYNNNMPNDLYVIKLSNKNANEIGSISYNLEGGNVIHLSGLYVLPEFQNNHFGTLLIILMFVDLMRNIPNTTEVYLEDCSDYTLTSKSIYFKFGFRITEEKSVDEMRMFIGDTARNTSYKHRYNNSTISEIPRHSSLKEYLRDIVTKNKIRVVGWDASYVVEKYKNGTRKYRVEQFDMRRFFKAQDLLPDQSRAKQRGGKINTKHGVRNIYTGLRGGRYVKVNGRFVLLSKVM